MTPAASDPCLDGRGIHRPSPLRRLTAKGKGCDQDIYITLSASPLLSNRRDGDSLQRFSRLNRWLVARKPGLSASLCSTGHPSTACPRHATTPPPPSRLEYSWTYCIAVGFACTDPVWGPTSMGQERSRSNDASSATPASFPAAWERCSFGTAGSGHARVSGFGHCQRDGPAERLGAGCWASCAGPALRANFGGPRPTVRCRLSF